MFAQIEYPEKLLPEQLDQYLALGWFRMRQTIFTTNFLYFSNQFYSAIWLRVALGDLKLDKKFQSLHRINKNFRTEIKLSACSHVSQQHELLYQSYRQSITFDISSTLQELLMGNEMYNRFNTHEVNMYDGETLVAAGFFDLGKNSAAGITSIYHPAYKKYSLGKYLMYLKMDYCEQQKVSFFYPGYIVPGYKAFDYKLEIGKNNLQYLQLSSGLWEKYLPSNPIIVPLRIMVERLELLMDLLSKRNLSVSILNYRFFEANLDPYYYSTALFDYPVFIYCRQHNEQDIFNLVVFDVQNNQYKMLRCSSVISIGYQQNHQPVFDSDLLKVEQQLFTTKNPGEMEAYILHFLCP